LVPIEFGQAAFSGPFDNNLIGKAAVDNDTSAGGVSRAKPYRATATSNVMCLSCHRAHASGFNSMTRWSNSHELITTLASDNVTARYGDRNIPALDNAIAMGRTSAEMQAAYYDRPASFFSPFQRSLCNKCHAKD
jgi:predicted CXXCH cytochrome family protein